jgi:hypothetical protein
METHMNKLSKVITVIFVSLFVIPAFAQGDVSSSELKTIQSRKFAAGIDKVAEAFKTYCEDSSGNYSAMPSFGANGKPSDTQSGTCMMGMKSPSAKNAAGTAAATSVGTSLFSAIPFIGAAVSIASSAKSISDADDMMSAIAQIKYEIKGSPSGKESTVRIRLMQRDQTQITDNITYDQMYSKIAEELSVAAVPIK